MTGLCTAGAEPDIYHGQGPQVLLARQSLSTLEPLYDETQGEASQASAKRPS